MGSVALVDSHVLRSRCSTVNRRASRRVRRRTMRITFVVPYLRSTTGGVYTIEQFSRHLSRRIRVYVVSKTAVTLGARASTRLAGGRLSLLSNGLPEADVLVVPADDPAGLDLLSFSPRKGVPVLFLQGFGRPPGAAAAEANLRHAERVVGVSAWLVDAARRRGCRAELVPPGLDPSLFFPGPPAEFRAPVVTLMTHTKDWKGTADARVAFEAVRAKEPAARFRSFGVSAPDDFPGEVIERPSRSSVGQIFRESAVFVCSSWEEGLGLPGIEALACGAALATTDTRGSRDYAVHGRTALVSPPRDPGALAASVVRLLAEPRLRGRLARVGRDHVKATYPPWPVAARAFESALERLE